MTPISEDQAASAAPLRRRRSAGEARALMLLILASLGLAGIVYLEVTRPVPDEGAVPAHAAALPAQPAAERNARFSLPPMQSFAEVVDRPLFTQTRRPAPLSTQEGSDASGFTLTGVTISPDERTALIEKGKPPTLVRLKEGQEIDGWTIASIRADRVVVQRGAQQEELKLRDRVTPRGPGPANQPAR